MRPTAGRVGAFNRQPTWPVYNTYMMSSFLNEPADSAGANQVLCADLSLLFTLFITRLMEAIARTGGKPLADQFAQQLNFYARQHGWNVLTGLGDLSELRRRLPDVDAKVLSSVLSGVRAVRAEVGPPDSGRAAAAIDDGRRADEYCRRISPRSILSIGLSIQHESRSFGRHTLMKKARLIPATIAGLLAVYIVWTIWQPGGAAVLLDVTHVLFAVCAWLAASPSCAPVGCLSRA